MSSSGTVSQHQPMVAFTLQRNSSGVYHSGESTPSSSSSSASGETTGQIFQPKIANGSISSSISNIKTGDCEAATEHLHETHKDTSRLHFVAGSISGFLTRCVCQPFDVIKIRFQLQLDPITEKCGSAKYSGLRQACLLILREEGVTAFWKGHIPGQALSVVYSGVQFYGFHYTKNTFYPDRNSNDFMSNFICGAVGASLAMGVAHPLDVLRTRLVAQGEPKTYSGMIDAVLTMKRREGWLAFYRGFCSNIVQVAPNTGASFGFYHLFRVLLADVPYVPANVVAGAIAGFAGKTLVYPFDLIKKRLQVQGFRDQTHTFGRYSNLRSCVRSVFQSEGLLGFFKGYVPSCMKAMATSSCMFSFYEASMFVLTSAQRRKIVDNLLQWEEAADDDQLNVDKPQGIATGPSESTSHDPLSTTPAPERLMERLAERQK